MKNERFIKFSKEAFLPMTGNLAPDNSSDMAIVEAKSLATFDGIYILNRQHLPVFVALDQLRQLGVAQPGQRKRALRVLAPSGSGKTTTIMTYAAKIEARLSDEDRAWKRPVVILSIYPKIKVKGWWSAVLHALGQEISRPRDTEETLRLRAYDAIRRFGVELLVIDEAQHLAVTSSMIGEVTDRLKRFLDDGIVPLVLVGTNDAKNMLQSNLQLVNRMLPPADILPLRPESTRDQKELEAFLKRLDAAIVDQGIMIEPAGLDDPLVAACLMEIGDGSLGRIVNLIRLALGRACRREATRIELVDLQAATAAWAVGQGVIKRNPFYSEGDR